MMPVFTFQISQNAAFQVMQFFISRHKDLNLNLMKHFGFIDAILGRCGRVCELTAH